MLPMRASIRIAFSLCFTAACLALAAALPVAASLPW
jgi:hypothetical protein